MRVATRIAAAALAASVTLAQDAEPPPPRDPLQDSGLVEHTRVSLLLLDVDVRDENGRPMPGLTAADFELQLDGKPWPIGTVDDLCACVEPVPGAPENAAGAAPSAEAASPPLAPPEPVRYVLHLNYGRMRQDGRYRTLEEVRRWLRETMQPEDEVMLTAWANHAGLQVLADFTSDRERLLAAVESSYVDPRLVDTLCDSRREHSEECQICCDNSTCDCEGCWYRLASEEFDHNGHALEALRSVLEQLASVPGRKALILFNEDGALQPMRYYLVSDSRERDHVGLLDEIAAEAARSRTAVHIAYTGELPNGIGVNLGANLADLTGGSYTQSLAQIEELTGRAGRGCACIYRLGLTPPDASAHHVFRAEVRVRNRPLATRARLSEISEADRWWRASRAVLRDPGRAQDLPVTAVIEPVKRDDGRWELNLQVAIPVDAIALLPDGRRFKGEWEVGALLFEERTGRSWELLGVSELRRATDSKSGTSLVHEHVVAGIAPGDYEMRAFVRDKVTRDWGGGRTTLHLPKGRVGMVGPVARHAALRQLRAALPVRTKQAGEPSRADARSGPVPLGVRNARAGEELEFASWICFGENKDSVYAARRFVSRDDEPVFRFDVPRVERAGDCARLTDRLDTTGLAPGRYAYHLEWLPSVGEAPLGSEVGFDLLSAP